MYTKICVVFIVFSVVPGFIFGMDQNYALCDAIQKGIISSLEINDYIVNVPNGYRALLKELSLEKDILQRMVKEKDERIRTLQKRRHIIYRNNCNCNCDLTNMPSLGSLEAEHSLFHINDMDYKPNCCNVMIPFYAMLFGITILTVGFWGAVLCS